MPITPTSSSGIFSQYLASAGITGANAPQLASALGNGLSSYLLSGVLVQTIDTGTLGVGVGTGNAILAPPTLISALSANFKGQGLLGSSVESIGMAIAYATAVIISTGIVNTSSVSVGVGAGVGTLTPSSAIPFFTGAFIGSGLIGDHASSFAISVANAIDVSLPTTVVTVAIAGPVSPFPSTGVGIGTIK